MLKTNLISVIFKTMLVLSIITALTITALSLIVKADNNQNKQENRNIINVVYEKKPDYTSKVYLVLCVDYKTEVAKIQNLKTLEIITVDISYEGLNLYDDLHRNDTIEILFNQSGKMIFARIYGHDGNLIQWDTNILEHFRFLHPETVDSIYEKQ